MTIRRRLIGWYAGALVASFLLMAGIMYYELVYERQEAVRWGRPREPVEEEIIEVILFYGVPTGLATVLGGGWVLRRALQPLQDLTRAAERVQAENLREPLPRTGNGDEVDRLSEVLNATTRRLDDAFMRIREFTLHASHELKTPLTVMRSELETALVGEPTGPAERERTLRLLAEVERLSHIVDSLTFLTKADAGQVVIRRENVALDELVQEASEDGQALAQATGVVVERGRCSEVQVLADRRRLRQLLLILTDNAIKYNRPGGRVRMELAREATQARITIANTGPGIPAHLLPRVFDRFYRGDAAHGHDVEGCGLGLTIAQWIVRAHGGELRLESELEHETVAVVTLPLDSNAPSLPVGAQMNELSS